jgi:hypothetical protein
MSASRANSAAEAGCIPLGLLILAIFFVLGALASLLNGEMTLVLEALAIAALFAATALWLRRRGGRS